MVASHVAARSYTSTVLHWPQWVDASQGFVFLTGLTLGIVHPRRVAKIGPRAADRHVWARALRVWRWSIGLVVLGMSSAALVDRPRGLPTIDELGGPLRAAWSVLRLGVTGAYVGVLPLYVPLLLVAPLVLRLVRVGHTRLALLASVVVWALTQRWPHAPVLGPLAVDGHGFAVGGWQILMVGGLVIGWHRTRLLEVVGRHRRPLVWLSVAATAVLAVFVTRFELLRQGRTETFHDLYDRLLVKPRLGLGRVLVFAVVAWPFTRATAGAIATRRLAPVVGALEALGRRSLPTYALHVPLAWTANVFVRGRAALWHDLAVWACFGVLLAAARSRTIARLVPA